MKLSPALILVASLFLSTILVVGVIESPENAERLIGLLSPLIGILFLALRQDLNAARLEKKTEAEAQVIKQTLACSSAMKDEKLDTIIKQTNGSMDEKFDRLGAQVEGAKKEVIEALPPVVVVKEPIIVKESTGSK